MSFIERVKLHGINALLGAFVSTSGFDRVCDGLVVTRIGTGEIEASLVVTPALANTYGTLHGGATSTLVDIMGSFALLSVNPLRAGVSIDLNVSFTRAAKIGETVRIVARVLKTGKMLGFTQVDLYKEDGTLVATGRHTKAL